MAAAGPKCCSHSSPARSIGSKGRSRPPDSRSRDAPDTRARYRGRADCTLMDWSLRGCSRQGHATYAPDEGELRERLHAKTALGEAWRCLRCGDFVLGSPHGSGPAADAPIVLRGKALREAFILRLLAVERWIRALILALVAAAVIKFETSQTSLQEFFDKELPRFKGA